MGCFFSSIDLIALHFLANCRFLVHFTDNKLVKTRRPSPDKKNILIRAFKSFILSESKSAGN